MERGERASVTCVLRAGGVTHHQWTWQSTFAGSSDVAVNVFAPLWSPLLVEKIKLCSQGTVQLQLVCPCSPPSSCSLAHLLPLISTADGGSVHHVLQQHHVCDTPQQCSGHLLCSSKGVVGSCITTKHNSNVDESKQGGRQHIWDWVSPVASKQSQPSQHCGWPSAARPK